MPVKRRNTVAKYWELENPRSKAMRVIGSRPVDHSAPFYGGWLFFLCNNTQHIGLQDHVPDFRLCCRTFALHPVTRFHYWQMNYHTEHHMYAAVPCYNLGKLHALIRHDLRLARMVLSLFGQRLPPSRRFRKKIRPTNTNRSCSTPRAEFSHTHSCHEFQTTRRCRHQGPPARPGAGLPPQFPGRRAGGRSQHVAIPHGSGALKRLAD